MMLIISFQFLFLNNFRHKNLAVRKTTAQFLVKVVEKMGAGKILSGVKDITDRVLPTAAHFAVDQSPETRYVLCLHTRAHTHSHSVLLSL